MTVIRRRTPPDSALLEGLAQSYYWDSFEAPLRRCDLTMPEIYLAVFAHHPRWARWLLILRGWLVAPFGLRRTTAAAFDSIEIKPTYLVGEKIARFTLYALNDTEILTGGDDRHLDFRVSVRKSTKDEAAWVTLTTSVNPHNLFGRIYLLVILPFHRLGVRMLLAQSLRAGRI